MQSERRLYQSRWSPRDMDIISKATRRMCAAYPQGKFEFVEDELASFAGFHPTPDDWALFTIYKEHWRCEVTYGIISGVTPKGTGQDLQSLLNQYLRGNPLVNHRANNDNVIGS